MRNLYEFIIKYIHVFLFISLEITCFVFIYKSSSYRQWAFNVSSKEITGPVLKLRSTYREYIQLKKINENLLEENRKLLCVSYNRELQLLQTITVLDSTAKPMYEYQKADVVENTINLQHNYIVLDKGKKDGITADMGVISPLGIVGVVKDVSHNYSIVLSVLHKNFSISAKVNTSNVSGILVWNGKNHTKAQLKHISSIDNIQIGDTVSIQHSLIFPESYPIGTVDYINKQVKGGYFELDVVLFEKMDRINKVWIVKNNYTAEITKLKNSVEDE